jgi:hypothetical protein
MWRASAYVAAAETLLYLGVWLAPMFRIGEIHTLFLMAAVVLSPLLWFVLAGRLWLLLRWAMTMASLGSWTSKFIAGSVGCLMTFIVLALSTHRFSFVHGFVVTTGLAYAAAAWSCSRQIAAPEQP